ncbi:MAG: hypothetical protein KJO84_08705 [Acidimicrobiia bacterium]|nr:hypothetical protein [Acidimicrobiia bacterium]
MTRRLLLIANPAASGFTGAKHRTVMATLNRDFDVEPIWPDGPAEAAAAARDAATSGFDVVAAMGGDGVVHHVANGIAYTTTSLAIIPAGTTNVYSRLLGYPHKATKAAETLATATPVTMPLVHMATESAAAARSEYGLFAVGIGFDADVVQVAESRPHGKLFFAGTHYARAVIGTLFRDYWRRPAHLRVQQAGKTADAVAVMVEVIGPYTYFGRLEMKIGSGRGPNALIARKLGVVSAWRAAYGMARTGPKQTRSLDVWERFDKLAIEADPRAPFQADGEHLGHTESLEITTCPEALSVLVPAE